MKNSYKLRGASQASTSAQYEVRAKLELYQGEKAAWHFATISKKTAAEIKFFTQASGVKRGWGSVRVRVTIGETTWHTSIFPSDDIYLLPVKAEVRKKENLKAGQMIRVQFSTVS